MLLTVSLLLMSAITQAHAVCTTWNAGFTAAKMTGHESEAVHYTWNSVSNCASFTFHHYLVCWRDGEVGTAPAAPTTPYAAGSTCHFTDATIGHAQGDEFVHRSYHDFGERLFACQNISCSQYYGDGTYGASVTGSADPATTDKERWVLEDIASYSDNDRAVTDNSANAPSSMVYGTNFTDANKLALYYSTGAGGVENIQMVKAGDTSWHTWNTYASWTSAIEVAESGTSGGAYGYTTHPWVIPVDDGTDQFVRLYVQADANGSAPYEVWSVDSTNEGGTDFGLTCTVGGGCHPDTGNCANGHYCDWDDDSATGGAATSEECASGAAGCYYLTSSSHGRTVFDYVFDSDHTVNFGTDTPLMLFTGEATGSACFTYSDQVFMGTWDGTAYDVNVSGACPTAARENVHDPGLMPLPYSEKKMYDQIGTSSYEVCYYDGSSWGDCEPVELAFDNGTTLGSLDSSIGGCTDNIDTIVRSNGAGGFDEGGFLHARNDIGGCFAASHAGIAYIEHRN